MTYKIAYLGPNYAWLHQLLTQEMPSEFEFTPLLSNRREEKEKLVEDADFVVVLYADASLIQHMKKVRLIQYHGTGYHGKIDLQACRDAGIPVATAPSGNTIEVAEHAVLLTLATLRILPVVHNAVKRGEWPMWELRPRMHNLEGKTIGIVGFGRIGRAVARRVLAFDTRIIYTDIEPACPEVEADYHASYKPLDDLLKSADVVTLTVPITPDTHGLLGLDRLRMMKHSAILVNVARGELVDEAALYTALKEGWIAGAGLDVLAQEPVSRTCPLLQLDNVVFSPHVASGTKDSLQKKARAWYDNFQLVLAGKMPNDLVLESMYSPVMPIITGQSPYEDA